MQTYLFYDIETTGLSKAFDQILQFAAIRTDLHLNELERYELKVKLNPDVIPAPRAVITHQIGVREASTGISEVDAIKQIHAWLNEPGTISLGYNTLGFDDEFLRFSFYRHLLPPYTHQYANQCSRMDVYPMAVMYFLFKKNTLTWPEINGKTSLKLDALNLANQFVGGRAHHAMVDVEATLALSQCFFKERAMWDYLVGYFNKQLDQMRFSQLQHSEALMIDGIFGTDQHYQCPVFALGNHHHYKNQTLWLKLDSEDLSKTTPETIQQTTRAMHKKWGEPSFILPFNDRFLQHLNAERRSLVAANKKWLQQQSDIFSCITHYHAEYLYTVYPETDIDASLYLNGFWSAEETLFCRRFHAASPSEKSCMTQHVTNPILKGLATRLLGRHYPDVLTAEQAAYFTEYMSKVNAQEDALRLIDYRGEKRLTSRVALEEVALLKQQSNYSREQYELLDELEQYLAKKVLGSVNISLGRARDP